VWLVYVLVFLWTGFPNVFAAVCTTFFVPLSLAGLGIVARGTAFAFRKLAPSLATARFLGALFAMSSLVTPFLLGCVVGGIAAGRVPASGAGDPWTSWTGPTSLVGGSLAVLTCAFLAATFLTREASLRDDPDLTAWCRRRAVGSGLAAGAVALVGIAPLRSDAPTLYDGLTGTALPLMLLSALAGTAALAALWWRRWDPARVAAAVAVSAVVAGWGVGQHPWMLVGSAEIEQSAAPRATLWALVIVVGLAAVLVLPPLAYLLSITQQAWWVHRGERSGRRREAGG
jgi:cytochrome d ubiquinol oxidase subunit II